jgi:predicted aminopeptidase
MSRLRHALRGRRSSARRWISAISLFAAGSFLSGCAPAYVVRLAYEEARILWRRQPITSLLAGDLDEHTRSQLELVLAVRKFAADELGLSVGGSYSSLARVDERQVVYVVSAAPRDRLEPYTWWFPIVGRVPYRGYFDRAAAQREATKLEEEGYDTYLRPSVAFSTLGWFDDPLLSNLLSLERARLAEVVLHELLHNTIYLSGQSSFNESFANFVGSRGAVAFFARDGESGPEERATALWEDSLEFSELLGEELARLQKAYDRGILPQQREALLRAVQADFARHEWRAGRSPLAEKTLNNAVLVQYRLYNDRLALFEEAYERNDQDLRATIAWVRKLVEKESDAYERLEMVLTPPAEIGLLNPPVRYVRICGRSRNLVRSAG